jgi:hypothetical protein
MTDLEACWHNARRCMDHAESTDHETTYKRFRRMAAAWIALAYEHDWLDGKVSPVPRMSEVRQGPCAPRSHSVKV